MRARKTETELRKEQIVEAALELISAEGVASLSIAGIAGKVGIVPSALYRHFRSKDEVLDALINYIQRRLLKNVAEAGSETSTAPQRLKSILLKHARLLQENRAIPHVVFSDGVYTGNPQRKKMVAEMMTAYLEKIEEVLEEGRQEGSLRADIVPRAASLLFIGMVLPVAVFEKITEEDFDIVAHAENTWTLFARCIGADSE